MPFQRLSQIHGPDGSERGFGLIELLIVILIIAIMTAMAYPSFSSLIRGNRIKTQNNDFLSASNYARNEAITRSRGVTLCAADTRNSTVPVACGASTDWTLGWMVFVDDTVGNAATPAAIADTAVLRTWEGNTRNVLIPETAVTFVRYNPRGLTNNIAVDLNFKLKPATDCSARQQRKIVISPLGRSSSKTEATCS